MPDLTSSGAAFLLRWKLSHQLFGDSRTMLLLDKIAESKIKSALDRGDLDNLPGTGKPLVLDDNSHIPADLRAGYRILKNAGFLPPELTLLAEIRQIEILLSTADCDSERKRLVIKAGLLRAKLTTR